MNSFDPARYHTVPKKGASKMNDQWSEKLHCPQCRNTGTASLSQLKGAQIPTVDSVTGGFKIVQTEYGPDFRCGVCDLPGVP